MQWLIICSFCLFYGQVSSIHTHARRIHGPRKWPLTNLTSKLAGLTPWDNVKRKCGMAAVKSIDHPTLIKSTNYPNALFVPRSRRVCLKLESPVTPGLIL